MKLPLKPPALENFFLLSQKSPELFRKILSNINVWDQSTNYNHWDKIRHLPPPSDLSNEQWWHGIKLARTASYKALPFKAIDGKAFVVSNTDIVSKDLYWLDQMLSKAMTGSDSFLNMALREMYLQSSLVNEAISSSQLEGAATTRKVAKEMIRQGREPRNQSDQMIKNNYDAMEYIHEHSLEKLEPSSVFTLHKILTDKTLDDQGKAGQFRTSNDTIFVIDDRNGDVIHTPPAAEELNERMERLCAFANDENEEVFIHPIIKAILLHFMIGYDHPFVDGNGRVARALFYWYAITHGYWLLEYISISSIIKMAPAKYIRAYLHTETDDNDTTYFVIHQLSIIKKAMRLFQANLQKQQEEISDAENILSKNLKLRSSLNSRQVFLIRSALKNPGQVYDIREHQSYHGVSYNSARTDLHALADDYNLLEKYKSGKRYLFRSPTNLRERLTGVDNSTA